MKSGRFFWKLFFGHVALTAFVLGASLWLVLSRFDRVREQEHDSHLRRWADALRAVVEQRFDSAHAAELDALVKNMGASDPEGIRITLVTADGRVLADSQADPAGMESHADRPEIQQALVQGWGESVRWSRTVSRDLKYFAVRVGPAGQSLGCVRVSLGMQAIAAQDASVHRLIWTIGLIGLVAALTLALGLSVLWSGRIFRLTATAHRLARGDLSAPIQSIGSDEVSMLARSMERMRERLRRQLATIEHQGQTLESLLAQLNEGVVVCTPQGRIVLMNPAAGRFLGLGDIAGLIGKAVEDCIHQPHLRALMRAAPIPESGVEERRLDFHTENGVRAVLARASEIALPGPGEGASVGEHPGRMVVGRLIALTDITELTRAFQVRSDFVANASHELRTPISALRAAVETMLQADLSKDAEHAKRFLSVIARHTARLEALVGDLLDLSRLESPGAAFRPAVLRLQSLCDELRDRWGEDMAQKQLQWQCDVMDNCSNLFANPQLIRLVLDNLLDNAIKFTDTGGQVGMRCRCQQSSVEIEIFDTGCGIPVHDQQRVFERFYQVESSRAPAQTRGTGLGLSIVKHAVAAMGGTVTLDSAPGRGTRVSVRIPNPQMAETIS